MVKIEKQQVMDLLRYIFTSLSVGRLDYVMLFKSHLSSFIFYLIFTILS